MRTLFFALIAMRSSLYSSATTSSYPLTQANIRGVSPSPLTSLVSTSGWDSRMRTTRGCCSMTAIHSGLQRICSRQREGRADEHKWPTR